MHIEYFENTLDIQKLISKMGMGEHRKYGKRTKQT